MECAIYIRPGLNEIPVKILSNMVIEGSVSKLQFILVVLAERRASYPPLRTVMIMNELMHSGDLHVANC